MNEELISVIVPVYNVEAYLPRCLGSIAAQTYRNLEVILVDDGSMDSSGKICDDFYDKFTPPRFRVIHQENKGISGARNTGLRAASGDYILMVDGDDALHPRMIEILYKLIESGDYDFSMCYGERIWDVKTIPAKSAREIDTDVVVEINRDTCMKNLYLGGGDIGLQYAAVWNKLFRRSLLENLNFLNTGQEDLEYNNRTYQKITKALLLPDRLYYYIQRPSSLMHSGINLRFVDVMNSYKICLDSISDDNKLYRSFCLRKMYRINMSRYYWSRNTPVFDIVYKKYKDLRALTIREFISNLNIPLLEKGALLICIYIPMIYGCFVSVSEFLAHKKHMTA